MRGVRWRRNRQGPRPGPGAPPLGTGRRWLLSAVAGVVVLLAGTIVWLALTAGPTVARLRDEALSRALSTSVALPSRPAAGTAAHHADAGSPPAGAHDAGDHRTPPSAPESGGAEDHGGLRTLVQSQLGPPPPPDPAARQGPGAAPADPADPVALPAGLADEPLPPAPDPGLVEQTAGGAVLPRIGDDGRQAWLNYRRPFDLGRDRPRIAIVITGLGISRQDTQQTIDAMPAPVTLAFYPLPQGVGDMMAEARADGHETLLMLPLEPVDYPRDDPGPLTLLTSQGPDQNGQQLATILGLASGYVGLVGEMGSRFAASPEAFRPMLQVLARRGLLYVDNHPTPETIAARLASEVGAARAIVDRVIDDVEAGDDIDLRLRQLEEIARSEGAAVGLAHPYPVTLSRLSVWAATLEAKAIDLAPVSAVANLQPDS